MDPIVSAACEELAQRHPFVLATIVRHQGSTPRTAGTRMLITAEQKIVGTIGGGLLEAKTMKVAAQMNGQVPARLLNFDLSDQDAADMGMLCGGSAQVLLDYISPNDENHALFNSWHASLSQGQRAMLVTVVLGSELQIERVDHALLMNDHTEKGHLELSSESYDRLYALSPKAAHVKILNLEERLVVADPGQIAPTLYLFGAGHVACPTAHLAALAGFGVVVLDDRKAFADSARFPDAVDVRALSSFKGAFEHLTVDKDTYIIIVTRGHLHDQIVLAQALKTPATYIGMIGSRRKRDAIYDRLLKDGYTAADTARVHCPIGIHIGADTPEEIAVSIVAELIAVRAGVR